MSCIPRCGWSHELYGHYFGKTGRLNDELRCKRTEMPPAKDVAAASFPQIKMQPLHILCGMKMLPPGIKIPTLKIKNEIKIRFKISIANFPGYIQHAVKASTCYQDKSANSIFIPDKNASKVVSSWDKHASSRLHFYPGQTCNVILDLETLVFVRVQAM